MSDSADGIGDFVVGLQLREHFLGGGGIAGDFFGVGEFCLLALLRELEVVQVRADDVHLLVEHGDELLAALDVLAELQRWLVIRRRVTGLVVSLNCCVSSASFFSSVPISS